LKACEPVESGFVNRDGVRISYAVYGGGERTLLFMPAWSIVHSRMWKAQIPYFARRFRVITFDARGNGLSDKDPALDYSDEANAADALAVMDATGTACATLIALSAGAMWSLIVAARHPQRVEQLICMGPAVPLAKRVPERAAAAAKFLETLDSHEGWLKFNRRYWNEHYRDFVEYFFNQALPEPHSTKPFEDCVGWAMETTPESLSATVLAPGKTEAETRELAAAVRCPVLVLHGDDDRIVAPAAGRALADATGGRFVLLGGSGHLPQARDPVRINVEILDTVEPPRPRLKNRRRRKRALFLSSPIGLGHAQRDAATAAELRKLRPDIDIEWLAQDPVTNVLRLRGETIHPASSALASETSHFESECGEHDLHAFQAIRSMDEILVNNFMVFYDLVRQGDYDLVFGDEAWDVDHFLHENPHEKRTAFVWMTDFVGWIPMPDGGAYERRITADYNAEMIEHIERFPNLRDRSIFVGDIEDVVPETFGENLPNIRDWTAAHYEFAGYVTGFAPPTEEQRRELRDRFGYRPDEKVCIVSVGGSGVGGALLQRIVAAYPYLKERLPELRMIVVAGPRIDPRRLSAASGVELHAYVPDLYKHLSACDIALVQGGLTTTMELTAARRPFVYFPLRHHFEQNIHVRYRLERYGAGECMEFSAATPGAIADAVERELKRTLNYLPVRSDGAEKAAAFIAQVV
jgi:pimeloyl-ACP methyl ester carboxylesterase/predicted glycosyltransferase